LLKKEEQRAWRKIEQTKKRADEIVQIRRDHERKLQEREVVARKVVPLACQSVGRLVVGCRGSQLSPRLRYKKRKWHRRI
jgi:hypothetical protein